MHVPTLQLPLPLVESSTGSPPPNNAEVFDILPNRFAIFPRRRFILPPLLAFSLGGGFRIFFRMELSI